VKFRKYIACAAKIRRIPPDIHASYEGAHVDEWKWNDVAAPVLDGVRVMGNWWLSNGTISNDAYHNLDYHRSRPLTKTTISSSAAAIAGLDFTYKKQPY